MQSSPTILVVVVCVFFLILVGMVTFAVFFIRKESAEKASIAQILGLTPMADTQPLLQRVAHVNGINRHDVYRLEHVYHRHHASGGDVYFFSLHRSYFNEQGVSRGNRPTGSHRTTLEASVLAFASSNWQLPRVMAIPRLGGDDAIASFGNNLTEAAVNIKYTVIKFPHIANLDENYLVATIESPVPEISFPDNFWRVLANHSGLRLHVGGDMLTLSYANSNTQTPGQEKLKELYKIGVHLAREMHR